MRDKDIKKIINNASDSEEYSMDSEEIKNALMEKIRKSGALQEQRDGGTVDPIFAVAHKEKKYSFAKITAGAAAACLGIGIIGAAAYNNSFGSEQLPTYNSDNISDTVYSENITPNIQTDLTASTENTVDSSFGNKVTPTIEEIQVPVEGTYIQWNSPNEKPADYKISLLDGTEVQYIDGETYFSGSDNSRAPVTKEKGKLYFTGDGKKRNITDQISADKYFCVSYVHPETGLTHYLIVGGDLQAKYYGYIELFGLPGDNEHAYTCYRFFTGNFKDISSDNPDKDLFDIPNKDWLDKTLKMISDTLKKKYHISGVIDGSGNITNYKTFPDEN